MVDWIQISQDSGSGDYTITITASTNQELTERSTQLLVSGITKSITVPIKQYEEGIHVDPNVVEFNRQSGTTVLNVYSTEAWEVTNIPDYCTLSQTSGDAGNVSVVLEISELPVTSSSRNDLIIFKSENYTERVSVYQKSRFIEEYLTFEVLAGGDFWYYGSAEFAVGTHNPKPIQYRKNNGEWITITSDTRFYVETGDVLSFKGNNNSYGAEREGYDTCSCFTLHEDGASPTTNSLRLRIYGNIMSLIGGNNFSQLNELTEDYTFKQLFSWLEGSIQDITNLELPAISLTKECYMQMFGHTYGHVSLNGYTATPALPSTKLADGCYESMFAYSSIIKAPSLPATVLYKNCYQETFRNCPSLTMAPELLATTLIESCYQQMFAGCTSLTTAPELPATTLAKWCYYGMFGVCTSLTTAPELPVTTLAYGCYEAMFSDCYSLTAAPALPATALVHGCYEEMFNNCTSLTIAPELPATVLVDRCYYWMFAGCTSLNYIKCLAIDNMGEHTTHLWVNDVSETGTFVKAQQAIWSIGDDGIPSGWTIEND